jgi:DNA-binding transcriptional regulator YdaS (Cro superfamily)
MSETQFDTIVKALGGVNETARAIGRTPSQVCQWRQRHGQFPAEVFFALRAALRGTGLADAAREVCRFDDVPRRRKRKAG